MNIGNATVTVLDGQNNILNMGIAIGPGAHSIAVNPVTNMIYVACEGDATVRVIDGMADVAVMSFYQLLPVMPAMMQPVPVAVAVNPATNKIYVSDVANEVVQVIDATADSITPIPLMGGMFPPFPQGIAVNPANNRIYVADGNSGRIWDIDGTVDMSTPILLMGGIAISAIAVNPANNRVFAADLGSNQVFSIDVNTFNQVTPVPVGTTPISISVDVVTNRVYVSNNDSANVSVLDGNGGNMPLATLTVGTGPAQLAANPVTNRIYVANRTSGDISVIDGAPHAIGMPIVTAFGPQKAVVNPVTNKIYIPNLSNNNATVIDGNTNIATPIAMALSNGVAPAINLVTNRIYVADSTGFGFVHVVDGATDTWIASITMNALTDSIAVNPVTNKIYSVSGNEFVVIDGANNMAGAPVSTLGMGAIAVAVNPVNNKVYVANNGSANVTVIDGATDTVIGVPLPADAAPFALAVNPVTSKVYVVNQGANNVTVIDGNEVVNPNTAGADIPVGTNPQAIEVDPLTNRIYVMNRTGNSVTVIDGSTDTVIDTIVLNQIQPISMTIDRAANRIYTVNIGSNNISVIDGISRTVISDIPFMMPSHIVANPATSRLYISSADTVTVIDAQQEAALPLPTTIALQGGGTVANTATPTFNFTTSASYLVGQNARTVYFQVDSVQGAWTQATPAMMSPNFTATLPTLTAGEHILYAYAVDATEGTSINPSASNGPTSGTSSNVGPLAAFAFVVVTGANIAPVFTNVNPAANATINVTAGVAVDGLNLDFDASGTAPITFTLSSMPVLPAGSTIAVDPMTGVVTGMFPVGSQGMFAITVTASNVTMMNATRTFNFNVTPPGMGVMTFTGPSATGTGMITASFVPDVNNGGCGYTFSQFIGPPPVMASTGAVPAPPLPLNFPHGLFDFTIGNCPVGVIATFTITYPSPLPAGTQYWKFGPTPMNNNPHWYVLPATISGVTATFSITDGGLGDDDLMANGTIVDQGGPGVSATIPTLSEWMLMLLGLLVMGSGVLLARRQGVFTPA